MDDQNLKNDRPNGKAGQSAGISDNSYGGVQRRRICHRDHIAGAGDRGTEYVGEDAAARAAVRIYGLNLFLASTLVSLLWRYAVREGLIRPDITDSDVKMITNRLTPGLAGYVVMIVLGLFLPVLAVLGYLIIAVYIIIPFGALRRRKATA
jgi:hypothetical protein